MHAAARVAEGRYEEALQELLAAWATTRAPELERAIDQVSAHAAAALPALEPGDAAFHERARLSRAVDVPALLERLVDAPKGGIPARIQALLVRPPDPRIGRALLGVIEAPPTTASANFAMWTALFGALPQLVDVRAADRLRRRAATHDGASQFWPKLTKWIEGALAKLPAPGVLPAELAPALVALERALADELPPLVVAEPAAPAAAGRTIALARRAAEAGDLEGALDALVEAWAGCRNPAVADTIDRLGTLVDARQPAIADAAAWTERGQAPPPSAVGGLLETWRDGTWAVGELRLTQMRTWAPDPRVCRSMWAVVFDYLVGGRRTTWDLIFDQIARHADPRLADEILALPAQLDGGYATQRRAALRHACGRVIDEVRATLAAPHALTPPEAEALAALDAVVAGHARPAPGADLERALVDAIVAAPDDDGPRLVYADWLREQGRTARAEFLTLDLALAAGKKVKGKRDKALKDAEAAIGPMAALCGSRTTFERGFPAHVELDVGRGQLEMSADRRRVVLEDPAWRLVRTVRSWSEGLWEALRHSPLDALQEVTGAVPLGRLLVLLDRPDPLPVAALEVTLDDTFDAWDRLDGLVRVLPALRRLSVMAWDRAARRVTPAEVFFRAALVGRLDTLSCGGDHVGGVSDAGEWLARLVAAGSPVPHVRLVGPHLEIALDRVEGGQYDLTVTAAVRTVGQANEVARWVANVDAAHVGAVRSVLEGDAADALREVLAGIGLAAA